MTALDIIVLIVFAGSLLLGFRKGVIMQAGSLGGIVLGVLACRLLADNVAQWLVAHGVAGGDGAGAGYGVSPVLANVLVFAGVYLAVRLAAHFCRQITHALALGFVDRMGGAVFSLFKWMLALSMVFNLWLVVSPKTDFQVLCPLANGHAIEAILAFGPSLLGWAIGC